MPVQAVQRLLMSEEVDNRSIILPKVPYIDGSILLACCEDHLLVWVKLDILKLIVCRSWLFEDLDRVLNA